MNQTQVRLDTYRCTKTVWAIELSQEEALRRGLINTNNALPTEQEGYLVQYDTGYESWIPKSVFDAGYIKEEEGATVTRDVLENASTQELHSLLTRIPEELNGRKQAEVEALKEKIIEKSEEVNELGRRVYTNKEIALILDVKTYYVAEVLKEYNNLGDKYTDDNGDTNDSK